MKIKLKLIMPMLTNKALLSRESFMSKRLMLKQKIN